jgi:hypothetical protein
MTTLRFGIIFLALMCLSWNLFASEEEKFIYYYTGCDNPDIYSDMEASISGIANFAKNNGIHLVELNKPKKCGYLLVSSEKKRPIKSVLTDIDLQLLSQMLSQKFFGLAR